MRLEFFGDSYDIVKRALIQWLAPLGQWYVQPLFTDDVSPHQATAFGRASLVRAWLSHSKLALRRSVRRLLMAVWGLGISL